MRYNSPNLVPRIFYVLNVIQSLLKEQFLRSSEVIVVSLFIPLHLSQKWFLFAILLYKSSCFTVVIVYCSALETLGGGIYGLETSSQRFHSASIHVIQGISGSCFPGEIFTLRI